MSYCTVLLPINGQSRKSFRESPFQPDMGAYVGKESNNSGVGSKELTSFQKRSRDSAFFFDRGRGVLPPIGKCEGSLAQAVVAAAPLPSLPPLLKLLAPIVPNLGLPL
jgi:hypothetical protein